MMSMDDTNATAQAARPTLKLKARLSAKREAAPLAPQPKEVAPRPQKLSPKASWSEEYIRQMQADMDALAGR
jgi:hypothetical protein